MTIIRLAKSSDVNALCQITLKTGHSGKDATSHFEEPNLLGQIYSAPYLKLSPELSIVAEHNNQVLGYCVGAANTVKFENQLETKWWPTLRERYRMPSRENSANWSEEEYFQHMIHRPSPTPEEIVDRFPAHLHMNLLPELRGKGVGSSLLEFWLQSARPLGVKAVHIGARPSNKKGIRFWSSQGFETLSLSGEQSNEKTVWMGRKTF